MAEADHVPPKEETPPLWVRPLSEAMRTKMEARIRRWQKRELWQLWEACDLAWHVLPVSFIRQAWVLRVTDSENFCDDRAVRAAIAEILPVKKTDTSPREWWVRPNDFCRWAATQSHVIGPDRAAVFAGLVRDEAPPISLSVRRRVLESGYSTPEFDAAIAAIAKFWLPVIEGSTSPPNNKRVKAWLEDTYKFSSNATGRVPIFV